MLPVLTQLDDLKASKSYTNGVFYGSVDYRLFFYNNVDCSLDAEIEALRYTSVEQSLMPLNLFLMSSSN